MKKRCILFVIVLLIAVAFSATVLNVHYVAAQTDQAEPKLQAASNAVGEAFNAVLEAERAGANVTGLLLGLNVAVPSRCPFGRRNQKVTSQHLAETASIQNSIYVFSKCQQELGKSLLLAKQKMAILVAAPIRVFCQLSPTQKAAGRASLKPQTLPSRFPARLRCRL
jgi:hypothetical protein